MLPELFRIPILDLPIYGYGVMLVLGLLAAIGLGKFLARRSGLDPEFFVNAAIVAIASGVVGARISHVIENFSIYTNPERSAWANFVDAINISSGGLTLFGGMLLGLPVTMLYAIWKKVPLLRGMDVAAPCIMLALALGRLGCLFNGCCHGAACSLPWAIQFPYHSNAYIQQFDDGQLSPPPQLITPTIHGEPALLPPVTLHEHYPELLPVAAAERSNPVHPTQIYSSFNALLLAAALLAYYTLPHAAGQVFALMLVLKGSTRFLLELLRTEPAVIGPMSLSMFIGLLLVAGGIVMWLALARRPVAAAVSAPAVQTAASSRE